MNEITLESLAQRLAIVEAKLAEKETTTNDPTWWTALGSVKNDEAYQSIIAEGRAIREAERAAARQEEEENLPK